VPEDTPTVAIIGNLDLDGNVVPGSAVRVPRSGFSIPAFPPDEIGSNVLGANDWNYRFVSFEYENDGETYITDPCLLADSEPEPPFDPTQYTYYRYIDETGETGWFPTSDPGGALFGTGVTPGLGGFLLWWASGTIGALEGFAIGGSLIEFKSQSGLPLDARVIAGVTNQPPIITTFTHSGGWEFSNDRNEVLAQWSGSGGS
jgi:hypothetical protein